MREIKFRAWLKRRDKMVYFGLFELDGEYIIREEVSIYDDDPVMQYTGLKDKNGVEIYEGDIYKLTVGDKYWVHVVKTFDGQFGVMLFGALLYKNFYVDVDTDEFVYEVSYINAGTRSFVHSGKDVEVIGNIYENPELLEETVK